MSIRFTLLILLSFLASCTSKDYSYYIQKGDALLGESQSDSTIIRCVTPEMTVIKEVIEGESGDWRNTHIQYYNSNGKLVGYKRLSGFFNSLCYDDVLWEISVYSFSKGVQKLEKHEIVTGNGITIKDTLECQFPYRYPYQLTLSL